MAEEPENVKLLREILKWTKFAGMNQLQSVLETTLNTPQKRSAYQLSDGENGVVRIAELSKVGSTFKVQSLWKEWRGKGLGDTVAVKGGDRFKRAFDIEDFGIEVPKVRIGTGPSQTAPNTDQVVGSPNA
jgi:hypothetical protein